MDENQKTDPAINPDSPINLEVKHKGIRFRYLYMGFSSVLVLLLLFVTDPDSKLLTALPIAAGFVATIVLLVSAVLYVTMLHLSRRAMFDYVDLSVFFSKAMETPTGAGLALIGVGLSSVAISLVILASVVGTK
jgi:hypothetical protein